MGYEEKLRIKPKHQGENYTRKEKSRGKIKIIKDQKMDMKHSVLAKNINNLKFSLKYNIFGTQNLYF